MKSIQSTVEIESLELGRHLYDVFTNRGYSIDFIQTDELIKIRVCDNDHAPATIEIRERKSGGSLVKIVSAAADNLLLTAGGFPIVDSRICGLEAPDFIFDFFIETLDKLGYRPSEVLEIFSSTHVAKKPSKRVRPKLETRKPGRKRDPDYDFAFMTYIDEGGNEEALKIAYAEWRKKRGLPPHHEKYDWDRFAKAMRYRDKQKRK